MCLFPKTLKNPRYKENKKNQGKIPPLLDERLLYVQVPCRECIECRKQKANEWRLRVIEQLKDGKPAHMVTLTLATESLRELFTTVKANDFEWGYSLDNDLGSLAVRRFLARWRKKYKKVPAHWLITELGQTGTEHLHLHGIIWTAHPERIASLWQYGFTWIGSYVGERTANYCVKYLLKGDTRHPSYRPKMFVSKGIGSHFLKTRDAQEAAYQGERTREYATTRTGHKIYLPRYYRNKIYTDEQREKLWLQKMDSEKKSVMGSQVSTKNGHDIYIHLIRNARAKNYRLGYGPTKPKQKEAQLKRETADRREVQRQRLDFEKTSK